MFSTDESSANEATVQHEAALVAAPETQDRPKAAPKPRNRPRKAVSGKTVAKKAKPASTRKVAARKPGHRKPFTFSLVRLKPGTRLVSTLKPGTICTVVSDKKVRFRGEEMSVSKAAKVLAHETGRKWPTIEGPCYWAKDGKTLNEMRPAGR